MAIKDKTSRAAAKQRTIQAATDRRDRKAKAPSNSTPPKTSTRSRPANPLPSQHLRKPGLEKDLRPQPKFRAPDYRGSGKLEGKVALVTGGDSGIGRAVAVLFAREGADVAIAYLNEHVDARETAKHVEREGRRCLLLPGDVCDASFCGASVESTVAAFGRLDVLVNNAAFQEHAARLEDLTDEQLDLTFKTNIIGYMRMARAALPHLPAGSAIINTGSETGLYGSKHLLDYSATKGAIHAFTKSLAANVVERGVRVNAVAPGPVWTPLNPADRPAKDVPSFGSQTDMKRPAQPEEIAPAYVFLASPACSSYITGIVLPILGSVPS